MTRMDQLGTALKILREERSVTQRKVGEALGVGAAAVSAWERGKKTPSVRRLGQIADLLDLDLGHLDEALAVAQDRPPRASTAEPLQRDADPGQLGQLLLGSPGLLAMSPAERALSDLLMSLRRLILFLQEKTEPSPRR